MRPRWSASAPSWRGSRTRRSRSNAGFGPFPREGLVQAHAETGCSGLCGLGPRRRMSRQKLRSSLIYKKNIELLREWQQPFPPLNPQSGEGICVFAHGLRASRLRQWVRCGARSIGRASALAFICKACFRGAALTAGKPAQGHLMRQAQKRARGVTRARRRAQRRTAPPRWGPPCATGPEPRQRTWRP